MLIHDDIFYWEGWGGKLLLGSGKCRLRIYDLKKGGIQGLAYLRPIVVIVCDVPDSKMSVRSCASHIATKVTQAFDIDPQRMMFIEHYPAITYGGKNEHLIPERYDAVEFTWHDDKAIRPRWKPLDASMAEILKELMKNSRNNP
jgi:hypothetical protein